MFPALWFYSTPGQSVSLPPVIDYLADASWMAFNIYLQANSTTPNPLAMNITYVRFYSAKSL